MNDVQEISEQNTQYDKGVGGNLFLDEEKSNSKGDGGNVFMNFEGSDNRLEEPNSVVIDLWQKLKEPKTQDSIVDLSQVPNVEEIPGKLGDLSVGPSLVEETCDDSEADDRTLNIQNSKMAEQESDAFIASDLNDSDSDDERTVAVEGFANRQPNAQKSVSAKISFGSLREPRPAASGGGSVYASSDANLAQAENLKLAQRRILDLEKEVERYRQENEELDSAGDIIRNRYEELTAKFFILEKEKQEVSDSLQNELLILKGTLQHKETEISMSRLKIEELETRLKSDFKKIRVRERELENRLELVKAEKTALLRAKDENILELKRKIDHVQSELDNYRHKVLELNKALGLNHEQFKRTVRALRLALSNLEVKEENLAPLKKAD
ncbi:MAG TPA: hypothetical protein VIG33_05335 [Pseudobdellovibrionaceae bacterium]